MSEQNAAPYARLFAPEVEAIAEAWSTSVESGDRWQETGKAWPTDSHPYEVKNGNNLRGVAKPGVNRPPDMVNRVVNEKVASDLAFMLNLPIPPITLWRRPVGGVGGPFAAVSAWAFPKVVEWGIARPLLTPQQLEWAGQAAAAMQVFDTWVGGQDRKDEHVLVADDGDASKLSFAYIDYAFSVHYEIAHGQQFQKLAKPPFPSGVVVCPVAQAEMVQRIAQVEEHRIGEIVNRLPTEVVSDDQRILITARLLEAQKGLKEIFGA